MKKNQKCNDEYRRRAIELIGFFVNFINTLSWIFIYVTLLVGALCSFILLIKFFPSIALLIVPNVLTIWLIIIKFFVLCLFGILSTLLFYLLIILFKRLNEKQKERFEQRKKELIDEISKNIITKIRKK